MTVAMRVCTIRASVVANTMLMFCFSSYNYQMCGARCTIDVHCDRKSLSDVLQEHGLSVVSRIGL